MNIKKPLLMIIAIIICLLMMRLGLWQLDRAEQKRTILRQSIELSELPSVPLSNLLTEIESNHQKMRFHGVSVLGHYMPEQSILIDNQVLDSKVGYLLLTPLQIKNSAKVVMVNRGWLPTGTSREVLPAFETPVEAQSLSGRLNFPIAQPPIWNDEYAVADGMVWAYLPIDEFRQQTGLDVLPLVLELAPTELAKQTTDNVAIEPIVQWQQIDDESVFKHQAYALQWFAMAAVFFIACLILLFSSMRKPTNNID